MAIPTLCSNPLFLPELTSLFNQFIGALKEKFGEGRGFGYRFRETPFMGALTVFVCGTLIMVLKGSAFKGSAKCVIEIIQSILLFYRGKISANFINANPRFA